MPFPPAHKHAAMKQPKKAYILTMVNPFDLCQSSHNRHAHSPKSHTISAEKRRLAQPHGVGRNLSPQATPTRPSRGTRHPRLARAVTMDAFRMTCSEWKRLTRPREATGKRHATHWNPGAPALASLGLRMDMARGCLEKTANMVRECAGNAHERAGKASHIIIFASGNSKLPPNTKGGGN